MPRLSRDPQLCFSMILAAELTFFGGSTHNPYFVRCRCAGALYFKILTRVDGCPQLFEQWGLGRLAKRAVWAYLIVYAGNAAVSLGAPLRGQKGARGFCYTRTFSGPAPIVRNGF